MTTWVHRFFAARPFIQIATFAAFAVLSLSAWSLSSPAGSSPDDNFHLASIWCAQGERQGLCDSITEDSVMVPNDVVNSACYAFKTEVTAACQSDLDSSWVEVQHVNYLDRGYPGGFYWVLSHFASDNVWLSVQLMRLINVLIFVAISAATFIFVRQSWRGPFAIALGITAVPLAMFIIPSTNPSSWILYSPAFLFVLTRTLARETRVPQRVGITVVMIAVVALAASARADAGFYAVVAVALALLAERQRWRQHRWLYLSSAGIALIAAIGVLSGSQSSAVATGLTDSTSQSARTSVALLIRNIVELPRLYAGISGTWGLGWLDTPMPAIVWVGMLTLIGGVVYSAIGFKTRREFVIPAIATLFLIAVPLLISQLSGAAIGAYVQPRYVLPLLALTLLALLSTANPRVFTSSRQLAVGAFAMVFANAGALATNVLRYTTGLQSTRFNFEESTRIALIVGASATLFGTIAFASLLFLAFNYLKLKSTFLFGVDNGHGTFDSHEVQRHANERANAEGNQSSGLKADWQS